MKVKNRDVAGERRKRGGMRKTRPVELRKWEIGSEKIGIGEFLRGKQKKENRNNRGNRKQVKKRNRKKKQ